MGKVLYSVDGQVGQDVEMIANYGDGGVYIEFSNGTRELVARDRIDFGYFANENKKAATGGMYTGPIPEVGMDPLETTTMGEDDETFLEEWAECCPQDDVDDLKSIERDIMAMKEMVEMLSDTIKERDEQIDRLTTENKEMQKTIEAAEDRLVQAGKDMVDYFKESVRQQNEVEKELKRANRIIDFLIQR